MLKETFANIWKCAVKVMPTCNQRCFETKCYSKRFSANFVFLCFVHKMFYGSGVYWLASLSIISTIFQSTQWYINGTDLMLFFWEHNFIWLKCHFAHLVLYSPLPSVYAFHVITVTLHLIWMWRQLSFLLIWGLVSRNWFTPRIVFCSYFNEQAVHWMLLFKGLCGGFDRNSMHYLLNCTQSRTHFLYTNVWKWVSILKPISHHLTHESNCLYWRNSEKMI